MMGKIRLTTAVALLGTLLMQTAQALPGPRTFLFTFSDGEQATATGCITLAGPALVTPFDFGIDLPSEAVQALSVTVSGASAGNGTFGLEDFSGIAWRSNGGLLDFSQELVGQATDNDPWGTPSDGDGGDFNLFGEPPAPDGVYYFYLGANGGAAEGMELKSMKASDSATCGNDSTEPTPVPVPAMNNGGMLTLLVLLAGLAVFTLRTRVRQSAD